MRKFLLTSVLLIAGCTMQDSPTTAIEIVVDPNHAALARMDRVRRIVEPVAEAECTRRTAGQNCDYVFQVLQDRRDPPNAYQTITDGRPVLIFNIRLLEDMNNDAELAFVMGHEAAHFILGHLQQRQENAMAGAIGLGVLAAGLGLGDAGIRTMVDLGGQVGSRVYSKDFELAADRLGTVISARSGFDPVLGAQYFNRIPDPGDQFLGTHPPNPERIRTVEETAARL